MRKTARTVLSLLLVLAFVLSAAAAAAEPSEETVSKIFKKYKTVGGMVVAAKDGEIVYRQCYGLANKIGKEPVTPETCFKLASVSKLVTAAAVMKLVEDGRLDLDENIGHILGDPQYEAANPNYPKIGLTSRMLMTHTATINDGTFSTSKITLTERLNPKQNKKKSGFIRQKPGTYYKY